MSCYLGKEQCVCNIISYMIEMNCNQYANSYKIFNLSQLQHNYSNEKKIKWQSSVSCSLQFGPYELLFWKT